jgi:signal peptidase II
VVNPLLFSALLVTALDQATKLLVTRHLEEGAVVVRGGVAFRRVLNPKAHSLVTGRSGLLVLWSLEMVLLLTLATVGPWARGAAEQIALGLVLGGVTGNFLDRLGRGGVVDFVAVGFLPVFNVADAAITSGLLLAALLVW